MQADAGQDSPKTHTYRTSAQRGQRSSLVSADPPANSLSPQEKRGIRALSRLAPFHKTRPLTATYNDSQNTKGHRSLCLEAMSVLTCTRVSHRVTKMWWWVGITGSFACRNAALLMLFGAPGPTSKKREMTGELSQLEQVHGPGFKGEGAQAYHWKNPRYVVRHPSCTLFFDPFWYPLGFSNLAPHPSSKKKKKWKITAWELGNL